MAGCDENEKREAESHPHGSRAGAPKPPYPSSPFAAAGSDGFGCATNEHFDPNAAFATVHQQDWQQEQQQDHHRQQPQQQQAAASTPASRADLLGAESAMAQLDRAWVLNTMQDLDQLSRSCDLPDIDHHRFYSTARTVHELAARVTGDLPASVPGQYQCARHAPIPVITTLTHFCSTHPETTTTATPSQAFPAAASSAKGKQRENDMDDGDMDDDDMDDNDMDDDDSAIKPCPWLGCMGTSRSKVFGPNRLKYIPSFPQLASG